MYCKDENKRKLGALLSAGTKHSNILMGLAWQQRRQRLSELLKTHDSPLGEADAIHDAIDAAGLVGLSPGELLTS